MQLPNVLADATTGRTIWELALEGAGQGVWDHDLVRGTAYYSPAWYQMRGFAVGEEVDAELGGWFDRLHPDERDKIIETTRRQNSGELPYNAFEYRERDRHGGWIWILSRGRPVAWNSDGSVARIVGTDTDITKLKLIEQQLAEEKERLHVTLQSIADGMISTGPDGCVTFVNAAAEQMTGWSLSDAMGQPVQHILRLGRENNPLLLDCPVQGCLESAQTVSLDDDVLLVTRSDKRLDVRLTVSPVLGLYSLVLGAVVVFQDVTQSRALKRQLTHSATHDDLTGLPNRVAFNQAIETAAQTARQQGRQHALCYLDLDHFKAVNDGAGHSAGDEVLVRVSDIIRRACRASDFAGRIGGDEFILLLSDCPVQNAQTICQKIVDQIASEIMTFGRKTFQIGASIGITSITNRQPSAIELTTEADAACYVAKAEGRGRVAVFSKGSDNASKENSPSLSGGR
jgi:diguanylate cyclase (GGDEF)-like protein/PAS domain S-box-containing protein